MRKGTGVIIRIAAIALCIMAGSGMRSSATDFTQLPAGNVEESPAWSHDGTFLAFSEERFRITYPDCCESGIHIALYAWGQSINLTGDVNNGYALQPAFAPDGSIVLASSYNTSPTDLALMAAGGRGRQLAPHPAEDRDPAVSPDGTRVAFASNRSGNYGVWIVPITGKEPVQLTSDPAADKDPAWSPMGRASPSRRIAAATWTSGSCGQAMVRCPGSRMIPRTTSSRPGHRMATASRSRLPETVSGTSGSHRICAP